MTAITPASIRAARLAAGLTQQALAHRLGVSVGAVRRWESDDPHQHREPTGLYRERLAAWIRRAERAQTA